MDKKTFAEFVDDSIRQAWLCGIGFHNEPLTEAEIAALNEIVRRTGVGKLVLKLGDVFSKDPVNLDEAQKIIDSIEGLGLTPARTHGGFDLRINSALDNAISKQVVAHKDLSRLVVYVNTPALAPSEKIAA